MKKVVSILLMLSLILCVNISVFASNNETFSDTVPFVTEINSNEFVINYSDVEETEDGNFKFLRTDKTNNTRSVNGSEVRQVAVVIPYTEEYREEIRTKIEENKNANNARGRIEHYDEKIDSSRSFTIFMTVNFVTETESNGMTYAKVVSANGGFTNQGGNYVGNGIYVRSQSLEVHTIGTGKGLGGGVINQVDTATFPNTNSGWSYTAPTNWQTVFHTAGGYYDISARYTVTSGRGTSTTTTETVLGISM